MMRKLLSIIGFISVAVCTSQGYYEVERPDRKNPIKDNKIFTAGRIFTYEIESNDLDLPEKVIYTVLDLPKSERTEKAETEVVISFIPDPGRLENTGIVDNTSNVWLHPTRTGPFFELETCPFPYAKLPLTEGAVWEDQLQVSERWSQGLWKGKMLFDIQYKVTGQRQFELDSENYNCWVIKSVAKSEVGSAGLVALYHEDKGFMQLEYETLKGNSLTFRLRSIDQGPIFQTMGAYISDKLQSNN